MAAMLYICDTFKLFMGLHVNEKIQGFKPECLFHLSIPFQLESVTHIQYINSVFDNIIG